MPAKRPHILIVDDEPDLLELLELTLLKMGLDVTRGHLGVRRARAALGKHFDLCLTDMRMPDGSGMHVVEFIAERKLDVPVAVMTAYASTENAVAALKAGAFDYLHKPVSLDDLRSLVKSALKVPDSDARRSRCRSAARQSTAMAHVAGLITRPGEERRARLHPRRVGHRARSSPRGCCIARARAPTRPFVPGQLRRDSRDADGVGVLRLSQGRVHRRRQRSHRLLPGGAPGHAVPRRSRRPAADDAGEAAARDPGSRVRKVGATQEEAVDVRIICATHQRLRDLVDQGKFRQDLYFRINVIELPMPPLREMHGDIANIAASLLSRLDKHGNAAFEPDAIAALQAYPFPGNVRELENILERALALAADPRRITVDDLHLSPARGESDEPGTLPARAACAAGLSGSAREARDPEGARANAEQTGRLRRRCWA
jgi:two-component system response regulator PilR (NtrC family)